MICCFTGPRFFPWGEGSPQHRELLYRLDTAVQLAMELGATHFLCGDAVGVDTWAAERVIHQKKHHPELFLEIVLPFSGHNEKEPACQAVCQTAYYVRVTGTSKCRRAAFYQRDRAMIERSDLLIAVEGPARNGGTARTLSLVQEKGIPILRIHSSSS